MAHFNKKVLTKEELNRYDGSDGVAYIAFRGKVYDVSRSFHWKKGVHQVVHHAGCDLTEELEKAPHGADMLEKFPIVGELIHRVVNEDDL
jgi:predicted heme/steroid binding protein